MYEKANKMFHFCVRFAVIGRFVLQLFKFRERNMHSESTRVPAKQPRTVQDRRLTGRDVTLSYVSSQLELSL